ncbi:hypothetical protein Sste5346_003785 [Sporothrix stenoceras]|uniref:Uncharacterized protein n=1 Tax=Sporothrix stenoceras TaxID=5173 RepID=A0ABR3ZBD5_9PEZI
MAHSRNSHTLKQESHRRDTNHHHHQQSSSVEMDRYGNASTTSNSSTGSASSFDSMDSYDGYGYDNSNVDQQAWMSFTIIEDDDLMFGGKPLCTWYEEDRRCSMGEEGAPSPCSSVDDDEEMHRGRQRDRPQYRSTKHKSEKKH